MAAEHSRILSLADIEMSKRGARIFANEMGQGFVGSVVEEYNDSKGHIITLLGAKRIRYGVCNPGGSDRIGWWPRVIEPWMVGHTFAQFVAVEGKTESYATASKDQKQFLGEVYKAGGVAFIARRDGDGVRFEEVGNES